MITVFGATGFTGQLIADVLSREGLPYRLAGRSAEKLSALSASLPGSPGWLVADAAQPATLSPLFQDSRLLINVAGPFTDLGEPVISRAAMSGVHYLDMTNELGFVFRMRGYHTAANRTGAALVPAAGFEVALSDCAAALVAARLGKASAAEPVEQLDVVYKINTGGGISNGTRKSMVRSMATSWIAYRNGDWVGQVPAGSAQYFQLPGGKRPAFSFPSCESITIPAHIPVNRIDTWMVGPAGVRFWGPVLFPLFARLSRSILRPLFLKMASGGQRPEPGAVEKGARDKSHFTILVRARRGKQARWITLQGRDPYGITAEIITYYARQLTDPGYQRSGLLAPAQAVDPQQFLQFAVDHWGVSLQEGEGLG